MSLQGPDPNFQANFHAVCPLQYTVLCLQEEVVELRFYAFIRKVTNGFGTKLTILT